MNKKFDLMLAVITLRMQGINSMDSTICLIDKFVLYHNFIIVAFAVERQAEGVNHSASALHL